MRTTISALTGILLTGFISFAAAEDCESAVSQADISNCAVKNYQHEDALLNQRYQLLLDKTQKSQQAALKDAQRAWISYRDLHCKFVATSAEGSSLYTALSSGCLADVTKVRNAELQALLSGQQ